MGTYEDEVGLVAFAQVAPVFHLEEVGGMVAHELDEPLDGEHALVNEFQHGHERELYEGHTRSGTHASAHFLAHAVGGMVGADGINLARTQGGTECLAVLSRLDGGIDLDAAAEAGIVLIGEEEVSHAGFSSDLRVGGVEEFQFAGGGEMGHVETGSRFARQPHGESRGTVTGFGVAHFGMMDDGGVVAAGGLDALQVGGNEMGVFAMSHDGQAAVLENGLQRPLIVHQHIARGRTHEEFHACDLAGIEFFKFIGVSCRGPEEEAVVHHTLFGCNAPFFFVSLPGGGLGQTVGHIKDGCHAAGCGSTAL